MSSPDLPSTSGPRHAIVATFALVYGVFLAFIVFWPSPIDQPVAGLLSRAISELHERGVPAFIDYEFIEFGANIVLFIPVGFMLGLSIPLRWFVLALVLGPMLSAAIEIAQRVLLEERYATMADVIANSIGATIGVLLAIGLRATVALRDDKVIERYEATRPVAHTR